MQRLAGVNESDVCRTVVVVVVTVVKIYTVFSTVNDDEILS